nr:hypothetical protein [Acinetobacter sp. Marseille-Q1620]
MEKVRYLSKSIMKYNVFMLFVASMLLATSGCSTSSLYQIVTGDVPEDSNQAEPLRKLNPNPQHAYKIRVILKNQSVDFQEVKGVAQFNVVNNQCGKIQPLSGVPPRITSNEPFKMTKISEGEYVGTMYSDMLLDGDYYKKGVCKWKLTEVRVVFSNTVDGKRTGFLADLDGESVQNQGVSTKYYWNGYNLRSLRSPQFTDFGMKDLNEVPEGRKHEFFTISINSKMINK